MKRALVKDTSKDIEETEPKAKPKASPKSAPKADKKPKPRKRSGLDGEVSGRGEDRFARKPADIKFGRPI